MIEAEYELEAMRRAVLKCDDNIRIFEAAIAQEQETKREYQRIVRHLEEQKAARDEVRSR